MQAKILAFTGLIAAGALASTVNTGGLSGVNKTYSAYSIGRGSFELGLSIKGEYGEQALHEYQATQIVLHDVVLLSQDVFVAFGLTNWMDVALDMPFYQDLINGFDEDAIGFGDFSASVKIMHPGMKSDALIRLAYIMRATFPTSLYDMGYYPREPQYAHLSQANGGGAFTSGGWKLNPVLAWTFDLQRLKSPKPWLVHVNFGMDALFYPDIKRNIPQENTAMQGGLAVEWMASPSWSVFLDLNGKSRLGNIQSGPFLEIFAKDQINLALGTKATFPSGINLSFVVDGSLSTQENFSEWETTHGGATRRYGVQPTPNVGATLTLGFGGVGRKADSDFDGNPNLLDKCPQDAEDYDGYADEDGCADLVHTANVVYPQIDTLIVVKRDTVVINDTVRVADTLQYASRQDPNQIFGFGKTVFTAINFRTGSDELNPTSFKTLLDIAQSLKNFPAVDLQVIGYTDNTGSPETNRVLSAKRAQAVVNYLVGQGIAVTRLQPIGMGVENPVGSNRTADGRSLNRRVEFKRVR